MIYNHATGVVAGTLGRIGELRFTPSGAAVLDLSVAVNKRRGETETTTWWKVTAWNELAERIAEDPANVVGSNVVAYWNELEADAYEGRDGIAAQVRVRAVGIDLFERRERDDADDRPRGRQQRDEAPAQQRTQSRSNGQGATSQRRQTATAGRGPAL